jgi:hypothetical protein
VSSLSSSDVEGMSIVSDDLYNQPPLSRAKYSTQSTDQAVYESLDNFPWQDIDIWDMAPDDCLRV